MKIALPFLFTVIAGWCSAQSSAPSELSAVRLATAGNGIVDSNASFAIGLSTNGGQLWHESATSADLVEVQGIVRPEAAHVGKRADIFLVDHVGTGFIMFTSTGGVVPWNGQIAALIPYRANVVLTAEARLDIFRGRLGTSGVHRLYLGYRTLDDGGLIYTPAPKTLTFTASTGGTGQSAGSNWQATAADRLIKHLGFELRPYDAATNRAGDMQFTQAQLSFNRVFFEYGFTVPANSAGPEKKNPQPTFILPLGTKVRAVIDGTVASITKLYSNDFSVMLQAPGSPLLFELEHVVNIQVAVGEKVSAGQVVAEVSNYDAHNYAGLGLFELGVLLGGGSGPPLHLCPFELLEPTAKEAILTNLDGLMKAWEQYRNDQSIHMERATATTGCLQLAPIEG